MSWILSSWRWAVGLSERSRSAGLALVLLVYALGLSLHLFLRGHAGDLGRPSISGEPVERLLFHGTPPLWLQRWTPDIALLHFLAGLLHSSFFFVPLLLVLLVFARLGLRAALDIVLLELAVFYSADAFFALFPSRPPWMDLPVQRLVQDVYGSHVGIDDNPVASIPSLHVAIPTLFTIWFARQRAASLRKLAVFAGLWTVSVTWAVVYSGEHYMVGAMSGSAWAAAVYVALKLLGFASARLATVLSRGSPPPLPQRAEAPATRLLIKE